MKDMHLQLVQKDTKTYTIRLTKNGVAENISGWKLYFTVKTDFNDADSAALISKDVTFPNNAESIAGIGYLSLTSSETNIAIGEYWYDMKFIATNYRETFLRGQINLVPSIRVS
jgi:hypothetical protein